MWSGFEDMCVCVESLLYPLTTVCVFIENPVYLCIFE